MISPVAPQLRIRAKVELQPLFDHNPDDTNRGNKSIRY